MIKYYCTFNWLQRTYIADREDNIVFTNSGHITTTKNNKFTTQKISLGSHIFVDVLNDLNVSNIA